MMIYYNIFILIKVRFKLYKNNDNNPVDASQYNITLTL